MTETQAADLSFSSRIMGMLYGVAFGDALGGPVEKLFRPANRGEIWPRHLHQPALAPDGRAVRTAQ